MLKHWTALLQRFSYSPEQSL